MMQPFQISHFVNCFFSLAGHGRVLEGVADNPFFFSSSSLPSIFITTLSAKKLRKRDKA